MHHGCPPQNYQQNHGSSKTILSFWEGFRPIFEGKCLFIGRVPNVIFFITQLQKNAQVKLGIIIFS